MPQPRLTQEQFLTRVKDRWGDKWDFTSTVYISNRVKVTITCREHGDFEVRPSNLLSGQGCPQCSSQSAGLPTFLERSRAKWGDRWDYSQTEYVNTKTKVTIICKEHGPFTQVPTMHWDGYVGCLNCRFIPKAVEVWGDRWDYSQVQFTNVNTPVAIVCPEHGVFQQAPVRHLKGMVGCPSCPSKNMKTPEDYIKQCREVWGDRWNYDLTLYSGITSKLRFICPEHGEFIQEASSHLQGKVGCAGCRGVDRDSQIQKAIAVWGDRWDYSKIRFGETRLRKAPIVCLEHGLYYQSWSSHLKGVVGCLKCAGKDLQSKIQQAQEVWGDRWDYSTIQVGKGSARKRTIICRKHGPFQQMWADHIRGLLGCTSCSSAGTSKAEAELFEYVRSLVPSAQQGVRCILPTRPLWELDIYIPELSLAIEYNGLYWHNEKQKGKNYHAEKTRLCKEQGIRLVHVWEDDWVNKTDIVKRTLSVLLHKSDLPKVAARKVEICHISYVEASDFLDQYHIQGAATASIYLGLIHLGEIVGVTTLQYRKDGSLELSRYATSKNVQGGHSKAVAYIEKHYEYTHLVTFADLSYSEGNLYSTTGWIEDGTIAPDYSYVVMKRREHKFAYRKARFKKDPDLLYQEGLTERELAEMNGLHRIYDAGKIRYIKPHP